MDSETSASTLNPVAGTPRKYFGNSFGHIQYADKTIVTDAEEIPSAEEIPLSAESLLSDTIGY